MGNPHVSGETPYVLEWDNAIGVCDESKRKVSNHLNKIHGVSSIREMDIASGRGKVTINISHAVDPDTVRFEFQKFERIKNVELILPEERPPPPSLNQQKMQLALLQPKPPLPQQHIVTQPPYGFSNTPLDESTIWKNTNDRDHPEFKLITNNKPFTCDGCKEDGFGSRYRREEQNCAFELHKECMNPNDTKAIKLLHESSETTFEFRHNPPPRELWCNACGKYIYGCFYSNRDVNFHPQCSGYKAQIEFEGTVLELREKNKLNCLWCNKKKSRDEKQSGIRGWSYVSKCRKYHFHLCCVTEMLYEAWKKGVFASDVHDTDEVISKALKITDSRQMAKLRTDGDKRGSKFWKIVKVVLKTKISILFGDPTVSIISVLEDAGHLQMK